MTIELDKWYCIQMGQCRLSGRTDGYNHSTQKWYTWVPDLDMWRPLPESALLYETLSPAASATKMAREAEKRAVAYRKLAEEREAKSRLAPLRSRPDASEDARPIIHRQGSVFREGDY